ncbi:hypothetical protein LOTGIDRAFT_228153 [Lottia gigantea]|uniref:Uncharacterized protein n=1 Tax=Lottia gigantea TaxID=225164 RepID=V4ANC7_LOTGI|nr:hypothetical protein LOTGIDRAFT_228153 [Lottia gigantea]ESP05674.1 hypothetical protein LOTGIDRAFT_228153 [Lottia gigantea]
MATDDGSVKKVCERFAEQTSMQGIPYINSSKTLVGKVIWSVLYLVAIGGLIFHLYYLCSVFFRYPKKTSVVLGFDTLQFPAVTVCNVNPLRKSMVHLVSSELQDLLNQVNPTRVRDFYEDLNVTSKRKKRSVDQNTDENSPLIRHKRFLDFLNVTNNDPMIEEDYFDEDDWESIGARDKADQLYQKFLKLFNYETRKNRLAIGHQLNNMLVKCSFAGRSCHADNFTQITSAYFGNCYTLQSRFFKSRRSGPNKGLELMLFLENYDYIDGVTSGTGAQILIHDQDEYPDPYDKGIALPTAMESHIGLRMVRISRMGKPFGLCNDSTSFQSYGLKYSRTICQDVCEANRIIDVCNCSDLFKEEINLRLKRSRSVPDKCQSVAELRCVGQVERNIETGEHECYCYDACSETMFEESVSFRQWPSENYAALLVEVVCGSKGDAVCQNLEENANNTQSLAQNFAKVNIYFEDLNYRNITEQQDYEASWERDVQLFSDIGGTMGLWIGLSFISFFEIAHFLRELFAVFHRRCFQDKNRVKNY